MTQRAVRIAGRCSLHDGKETSDCGGPCCVPRGGRLRRGRRAAQREEARRARPQAERRRHPERRRAARRRLGDEKRPASPRRPRRHLLELSRHDLGMRPVPREHPARAIRPSHGRPRQLRPPQLPRVRSELDPRRLASLDRLPHGAHRQVPERLHAVRQQRDPARLGRLPGDGQRPDGGVLQLHGQRQRPARALRHCGRRTTRRPC